MLELYDNRSIGSMSAVQRQRARRAALIRERLTAPMICMLHLLNTFIHLHPLMLMHHIMLSCDIAPLKHGLTNHLEGLLRSRPSEEESLKRELQKKRILPSDGNLFGPVRINSIQTFLIITTNDVTM
jgi:hypothetical protein